MRFSLSDAKRTKIGESQGKTERRIAVHYKNPVKGGRLREADTNSRKSAPTHQIKGRPLKKVRIKLGGP